MWISDRAIFEDMVKMIERSGVGLGEERSERRVGEQVGEREEQLDEALEKTGGGLPGGLSGGLGCWARYGVCLTR